MELPGFCVWLEPTVVLQVTSVYTVVCVCVCAQMCTSSWCLPTNLAKASFSTGSVNALYGASVSVHAGRLARKAKIKYVFA